MQGMLMITENPAQIFVPKPLGLARSKVLHTMQKRSMAIESGRNPFMEGIGSSNI